MPCKPITTSLETIHDHLSLPVSTPVGYLSLILTCVCIHTMIMSVCLHALLEFLLKILIIATRQHDTTMDDADLEEEIAWRETSILLGALEDDEYWLEL